MSAPGLWEIVALAVLALLIFGPDKLPGMLRSLGKTIGGVRREASAAVRELKETGELEEIQQVAKDLRGESQELRRAADLRGSGRRPPRSAKGLAAAAAGSVWADAVRDDRGQRDAAKDGQGAEAPADGQRAEAPADGHGAAEAEPALAGPPPFDPDAT